MSIPFRLQIPRRLYNQMLAQAVAELPNECCGLLAGRIEAPDGSVPENRVGRVLECYPLVNAAASPQEYLSDAQSMFAAVREIDRLGLEILAVDHSHPATEPVPSKTDLKRNYYGDVMHLIISLKADVPVMRAWRLTEVDYREAEWECIDESTA